MRLADKINFLRKQRRYTMQELADKSGLTKGYISMLEKGEHPRSKKEIIPSLETVQKLALAFNIDLETLLYDVDSNVELPTANEGLQFNANTMINDSNNPDVILPIFNSLTPTNQTKVYNYANELLAEQQIVKEDNVIYIYGAVSAGTGEYLEMEHKETLTYNGAVPKHDFALRVNGNSMEPAITDGEIIFIRKDNGIRDGRFVIVALNNEAFVKKLVCSGDKILLRSLNDEYKDIIVNEFDDLIILGTVVL